MIEHKLGILEIAIPLISNELKKWKDYENKESSSFEFFDAANKATLFITKGDSSALGERYKWLLLQKINYREESIFSKALIASNPKTSSLWDYRF